MQQKEGVSKTGMGVSIRNKKGINAHEGGIRGEICSTWANMYHNRVSEVV